MTPKLSFFTIVCSQLWVLFFFCWQIIAVRFWKGSQKSNNLGFIFIVACALALWYTEDHDDISLPWHFIICSESKCPIWEIWNNVGAQTKGAGAEMAMTLTGVGFVSTLPWFLKGNDKALHSVMLPPVFGVSFVWQPPAPNHSSAGGLESEWKSM